MCVCVCVCAYVYAYVCVTFVTWGSFWFEDRNVMHGFMHFKSVRGYHKGHNDCETPDTHVRFGTVVVGIVVVGIVVVGGVVPVRLFASVRK